jgi:hypothetical protein
MKPVERRSGHLERRNKLLRESDVSLPRNRHPVFTGESRVVGRLCYMSPEQVETKETDERSNIGALYGGRARKANR